MSEKSNVSMKKDLLRELKFLSLLGILIFIFPFTGRSKGVIFCFGFIYFLILLTATQLLITLCLKDFGDWIEIINVVPNLAVVLMAALKYGKVHFNQVTYKKIFDHYRDNLWDFVSDSEQQRNIVVKYIAYSRYINRFLFYYSALLVIIVNSFPRIIMFLEELITGEESQLLYPFEGWYPFDKIHWFYTAYIWEGFMTSIIVYIYGFVSMVNSSYTLFICMELTVLGDSVMSLISPSDIDNITKSQHVFETNQNIKKKLRNIFFRHQLLARISSEFNTVLGDAMLLNYVFGSVFITLTIFTATVVDNLYKRMRYFFMFCSLLMEMFHQCLLGQVLGDHSEGLAEAIYSANWIYGDNDTKKMLLIFMTRSQRPFQYTAKGYLAMNFQSFSGICSMSYQFFNLLHTAYK